MAKIHEMLKGPENWVQGKMGTSQSCHCLYGWLNVCYWGELEDSQVYSRNMERIREHIGGDGAIAKWNDHPDRTFEEVKALCVKLDI